MSGIVANTPEAIAVVQLISVKAALKLEAKGLRMTRTSTLKLRKPWALKLGLKANASYDEVIAAIEERLAAAKSDPRAQLQTF